MIQLHCDFSFCSQFPLKIHFQIIDAKSEWNGIWNKILPKTRKYVKKYDKMIFQQIQTHCCT